MNPQFAMIATFWGPALMVCFSVLIGIIFQSSRLSRLEAEITSFRTEMKTESSGLRTELKTEMNNLRTELKTEINSLRTELKTDIANLRTELTNLVNVRFDALQSMLHAEVKRLDDRIDNPARLVRS